MRREWGLCERTNAGATPQSNFTVSRLNKNSGGREEEVEKEDGRTDERSK